MFGRLLFTLGVVAAAISVAATAAAPTGPAGYEQAQQKLDHHRGVQAGVRATSTGVVARNFELLGHHDLGLSETNGDVWVHGNFAYVGTWVDPSAGRGSRSSMSRI